MMMMATIHKHVYFYQSRHASIELPGRRIREEERHFEFIMLTTRGSKGEGGGGGGLRRG
jgi:hypothetical protein